MSFLTVVAFVGVAYAKSQPFPTHSDIAGICNHPPVLKSVAEIVFPPNPYQGGTKRSYAMASITVNSLGSAVQVRLISDEGNPRVDSAIIAALKHSSYVPAGKHCSPTAGKMVLQVSFLTHTLIEHPCDHPPLKVATAIPAFPMEILPRRSINIPIRVVVNRFGAVIGARVVAPAKSIKLQRLQRLETRMAFGSSYLPAVRHCIPVNEASIFLFRWHR